MYTRCLAILAVLGTTAIAAAPYRKTLTSVEGNTRTGDWRLTPADAGVPGSGSWSVEQRTLHGGRQEGVELIVLDNGALAITLVPTRGMSVLEVRRGDVRLGWTSPVKEVVHPSFIDLQSRGGLGWLEGFNEWMVRCGLEWAGHPGRDEFVNNVGDRAQMDLTLHGRIGNIPASEVEVVVDREPPHRIRVRGRVDERMFYGPQLELWAEVSTEPGSTSFRIEDRITNHAAEEQEFQVIYHANFGPPLLGAGARFVGAVRRITPFNRHAATGLGQFDRYGPPTPGFVEQVYGLEPFAGPDGNTTIMLQSPAADLAASMTFAVEQLPYVTLWKNLPALEAGYVTGLEPGTSFPANRRIERQAGRVPRLPPGASRAFAIEVAVLQGAPEVAAAADRVRALQAGRPTEIDTGTIVP